MQTEQEGKLSRQPAEHGGEKTVHSKHISLLGQLAHKVTVTKQGIQITSTFKTAVS